MQKLSPLARNRRRSWPHTVRRWTLGLALPALLNACAHQTPHSTPKPLAANIPDLRVFHVGPSRDGQRRLDTYAAGLPEASPVLSAEAIIENILSRRKLPPSPPAAQPGAALPSLPATLPAQPGLATTGNTAKVSIKKTPAKSAAKKYHPRDHWERVRERMVLAGVEHETVTAQLDALRNHPGAVDFLMKRAEPYLPYLLEEIDRHGLPADLVLVPMVESAFEPAAVSPKQAAGIWQFIPSTGAQYGLLQVEGYDGRYDLHAATQAALKYLTRLHKLFNGDWLLALASYNAGEGAVGRAVEASRKAGQTGTFWELTLPAETHAYVLKILALAHAVADPEGYGLKPHKAGPAPYLARVRVEPEVNLAEVVATAGMPPEDFYRLNPAFKPELAPPPGTYHLLMPMDRAETLAAVHLPGTTVLAMRKVVVKRGETLSILAKRHGVPEPKLAEWNGLKPKSPLKAGQELVVFPA